MTKSSKLQHDPISRSENMRRIRSLDTRPEMLVRSLLFRSGFRYRLHAKQLPGTPDLVFKRLRKAIFVHGCFWHAHGCRVSHSPKTNTKYWSPKLTKNIRRDADNVTALSKLGWQCLVVWECQIKADPDSVLDKITSFLRGADTVNPAGLYT